MTEEHDESIRPSVGRQRPAARSRSAADRHSVDFPYQRDLDVYVTRREYLRLLVLTSFGLFLGTAAIAVGAQLPRRPAAPQRIASVEDVPEGAVRQFHYPTPDDPAILIHLPSGFVAYSQLCTHLACAVLWDQQHRVLDCPCHEGRFDPETGRVLSGPPPRPLPRIALQIREGEIYAVEEIS